jgi:hypothetical protein
LLLLLLWLWLWLWLSCRRSLRVFGVRGAVVRSARLAVSGWGGKEWTGRHSVPKSGVLRRVCTFEGSEAVAIKNTKGRRRTRQGERGR